MKKLALLFILCLVFIVGAIAQKKVTGKVTDESEDGLPGVSIVEKGTTNGTTTDIDGNYSLNVHANAVLIFSFVGMQTQELPVNEKSTINATLLEETAMIDEVVVTALGMKRETKKLGYAMTEVEGEELAATNTVNPVLALQGKAAGVSVGGSDGGLFGNSKIQIRGISVLNSSNNQPIFVVDGVILENPASNTERGNAEWNSSANDFGNQLKNLNPDDYATVSVLKGAAATALYGSRAINGAVIITTKDGKGAKGIGVTIKQTLGFDHVYNYPDIQYEFGPGAIAGFTDYGESKANGEKYRFSTNQFYTNVDGIPTQINHPWEWAGYGPRYDGRPMEGYDGEMTTYSPAKDNVLDAYDLGLNSNTSVILRGGNERGNFYLSDSYNYRKGTLPNNAFNRNSLLFRASYQLSEWLKAEASISYVNSISRNPRNDVGEYFILGDWVNWYDVNKYKKRKYWQAKHGGVPSTNNGDEYGNLPKRDIWFAFNMDQEKRSEDVTRPIIRLTADITDWLSITGEVNMNYYTSKFEDKELGQGIANDGGKYRLSHLTDKTRTGKFMANINKNITEDISTRFMLGGEIWKQEKTKTSVKTDNGLIFPGKYFIDNSRKQPIASGSISGTKKISSLYFLASFGYKEQVFLDLTGRNDWSSALVYTDGTGNHSYFYPSVSTSWVFHETLPLPAWITFGKLRASWAQVGNDTDPYLINKGYSLNTYEIEEQKLTATNSINTTLVDRDIKPERKNSFELGTNLRFFNNRLDIDFAYYNETIKKQIGTIPLPSESGYSGYLTNIGTLKNHGIELSVKGTPIRTRDFEWIATVNYWDNTTKVKNLHENYGAYKQLDGGGYTSYGNFRIGSVAFDGGKYGVLMSDYAPKVDANGNKILIWNDKRRGAYYKQNKESVQVIGSMQPDFEGSLENTFSYKGFTLSILIDARFGGDVASFANRYGTAYGWLKTSLHGRTSEYGGITWTSQYDDSKGETFADGVIPEGVFEKGTTVTTPTGNRVDVSGMSYQEAYDKGFVEPTHASYYTFRTNAWSTGVINDNWFNELNYIALRSISLGYNLPKSWAEKIKTRNIYASISARNLGYLHNSLPNNIHPESFRGTSSDGTYLIRSFSPYIATYSMTIAIDF